ncbi:hypothetical protein EC9_12160 [Rosistilla ulvae]|uniref:Methyltransferase domain-containing protein n=1 Tax=Rosistilla ulvae TaxID=1930277 RepID=A0A517LWQ9_9BACT|nr:class I SAM-dependent methyltransferase [Rosistilla ulvae]QDS87040.1 hypothetical protein EC9_12160 [Rosistilla ulvae]
MNLSYAIAALRKRGFRFIYTYAKESLAFDLRHGTRTSARVPKESQSLTGSTQDAENGLLYVASFTSVTRNSVALAKRLLGEEQFRSFQFLDMGCGKGKALLVHALGNADHSIHPSIGIEYDPDLAKIANANIAKTSLDPEKVKVVVDSAVEFENFVSSDKLLIYLYNSFQGETLRAVLRKLKNYQHMLVYVDPAEKEVLHEFGYVIHQNVQGKYNADTWLLASMNIDNMNQQAAPTEVRAVA